MTPTFEQAIEIIRQLPPSEREKLRDWIDEENQKISAEESKREKLARENERFRRALKWIDEHKEEFDGQWVCLDGDKLIAHGFDGKKVYQEAKEKGIETPFLERIKANELPYGPW
jgi:flagellar motility protein MotE (MotC chaperone)